MDIKEFFEKVEQDFSSRKEFFEEWGQESALSAFRWFVAYKVADNLMDDMSTKDLAEYLVDNGIPGIPKTIEDLEEEVTYHGLTFEDYLEFYSESKEESEDEE